MAGMLYNIFSDFGLGEWTIVVVVLSLFIDLTPGIKFNPIKFIVKQIGTAFNHTVDKKLDQFDEKVTGRIDSIDDQLSNLKEENTIQSHNFESLKRDVDIAELNRLKLQILDFSNRLSRRQLFTTEEYRTVMDSYSRYHEIIDRYDDLTNGKIDAEYNYIVKHYMENKDKGEYMF